MRYMLERAFFEMIHFPFSFPALRGIDGGGHFKAILASLIRRVLYKDNSMENDEILKLKCSDFFFTKYLYLVYGQIYHM